MQNEVNLMQYRQCLIFYTVAKEKSFTRAATKLFMTQSAISHTMKDLEAEAGIPLFERLHRKIELTAAGNTLLTAVTPLVEKFQQVEIQLQNLEQSAPLRLASCITYGEITLPEVLQQFKKQLPQQKITVHISPADDCFKKLAAGKVDLAILEGRVPSEKYQQKVIANYPLVFVAAPNFFTHSNWQADFAGTFKSALAAKRARLSCKRNLRSLPNAKRTTLLSSVGKY